MLETHDEDNAQVVQREQKILLWLNEEKARRIYRWTARDDDAKKKKKFYSDHSPPAYQKRTESGTAATPKFALSVAMSLSPVSLP